MRLLTTAQAAKRLGVSVSTIIRRCDAGLIPFIDHGNNFPRRMISVETVKLIETYGLRGVAAMREAGTI